MNVCTHCRGTFSRHFYSLLVNGRMNHVEFTFTIHILYSLLGFTVVVDCECACLFSTLPNYDTVLVIIIGS
jgi:hypothetical protein